MALSFALLSRTLAAPVRAQMSSSSSARRQSSSSSSSSSTLPARRPVSRLCAGRVLVSALAAPTTPCHALVPHRLFSSQPPAKFDPLEMPAVRRRPWLRPFFWIAGYYLPMHVRERAADRMWKILAAHADRPEMYAMTRLPQGVPGFFSHCVYLLWLTYVRLRSEGRAGQKLFEDLFAAFWREFERRILFVYKIENPMELSRSLKKFAFAYQGSMLAYDEGLQEGDATLAEAVWRNLLRTECDDPLVIASIVQYARKEIMLMERSLPSETLLQGFVSFSLPAPRADF